MSPPAYFPCGSRVDFLSSGNGRRNHTDVSRYTAPLYSEFAEGRSWTWGAGGGTSLRIMAVPSECCFCTQAGTATAEVAVGLARIGAKTGRNKNGASGRESVRHREILWEREKAESSKKRTKKGRARRPEKGVDYTLLEKERRWGWRGWWRLRVWVRGRIWAKQGTATAGDGVSNERIS